MLDGNDPKTLDDYNRLIHLGQRMTGFGTDVTMHMPCYFCATPDFVEWKIAEMRETASKPHTCKACGRSAKLVFTDDGDGSVSFEVVQTGGRDPADYLPPMRRVTE